LKLFLIISKEILDFIWKCQLSFVILHHNYFIHYFKTLKIMGYYTLHQLEIVKGNDGVTDYEKEISELSEYADCFSDSIKWYEHETDMRVYSLKHPNTLFKLSGEGEESGDIWAEYYLNGKMQKVYAEIVLAPFDESKLS
jgi:hypothetical protein